MTFSFSISQIAGLLGGTVEGNADVAISTLTPIDKGCAGAISFLSNPAYEHFLYQTAASAVIVAKDFQLKSPVKVPLIRVENPYIAFSTLLQTADKLLNPPKRGIEVAISVHPSTQLPEICFIGAFCSIGANVKIGEGVEIHPNCTIGDNVSIGAGTILKSNVSIYNNSVIGKNCLIHSGVIIGSDGFGHAPQPDGSYLKIPHLGNVEIGDFVEIGANTTIDRGTMGSTKIETGVKLDNLIQIAHNVSIGANTVIAAQTGIAGSTQIGKNCMIGGQVGIVGHITIADGVKIGAQSGVSKNITEPNSNWRGSPAQAYRQQLKSEVLFQQLEQIQQRLLKLEKEK